jgi:AcrR family transcriptional regulator
MSARSRSTGEVAGIDSRKLPKGRHKLPREVVVGHQRERLLAAAAMAMADCGYAEMSVEQILVKAKVSRTTFYENFENKRDCVLMAHEAVFDRLVDELIRASSSASEWPEKIAVAVAAAIDFAVRAPEEAQLLVLEAAAAEPALVVKVLASNDYLVGLLRTGREYCPEAASLPELTERALIGATVSVIGARLLSGQTDQLPGLEPQLVQLILMPYLGIEEAARVAQGPSLRLA